MKRDALHTPSLPRAVHQDCEWREAAGNKPLPSKSDSLTAKSRFAITFAITHETERKAQGFRPAFGK